MKKQTFLLVGLFLIFMFFNNTQTKNKIEFSNEILSDNLISTIQIKKINVFAPIIYSNSTDENILQQYLQSGVVHLPNSVMPGEIGNVYIIGHSSDYVLNPGNFKTIFEELEKLENKDEVVINYNDTAYKYLVFEKRIIESTDLSVFSQETQGKRLLTLQTSYPISTSQKRLIILAELFQ